MGLGNQILQYYVSLRICINPINFVRIVEGNCPLEAKVKFGVTFCGRKPSPELIRVKFAKFHLDWFKPKNQPLE